MSFKSFYEVFSSKVTWKDALSQNGIKNLLEIAYNAGAENKKTWTPLSEQKPIKEDGCYNKSLRENIVVWATDTHQWVGCWNSPREATHWCPLPKEAPQLTEYEKAYDDFLRASRDGFIPDNKIPEWFFNKGREVELKIHHTKTDI